MATQTRADEAEAKQRRRQFEDDEAQRRSTQGGSLISLAAFQRMTDEQKRQYLQRQEDEKAVAAVRVDQQKSAVRRQREFEDAEAARREEREDTLKGIRDRQAQEVERLRKTLDQEAFDRQIENIGKVRTRAEAEARAQYAEQLKAYRDVFLEPAIAESRRLLDVLQVGGTEGPVIHGWAVPAPDEARGPSLEDYVPAFAGGIRDFAGGLALVGERGPELVRLPGGSDVIPTVVPPVMPRSAGGDDGAVVLSPESVEVLAQALARQSFEVGVTLDGQQLASSVAYRRMRQVRGFGGVAP